MPPINSWRFLWQVRSGLPVTLPQRVARPSERICFSLGGVRRWQRHLIVQGREHPLAILLYVDVREVECTAETRVWIGYPGVLRSRFRSGSFNLQIPSHDSTVPIESKLEILSLILIPVKLASFNQIG